MNRASLPVLSVLLLSSAFAYSSFQSSVTAQGRPGKYRAHRGKRVPNQYVVVLADAAGGGEASTEETVAAVAADLVVAHGGRRRHLYTRALRGFSVALSEAAARRLSEDRRVAYVEEDGVAYGTSMQSNPQNWGLDRIDQRVGLDWTYSYFADGSGVNIYVVDSGMMLSNVEFEGRALWAYDAVGDGLPPGVDCTGHGTHVAGIAASATYGVAKNATLHAVRALGCDNQGLWTDYIEALDWVAAHHVKPAVVNASIAGMTMTSANLAIERLAEAGVTFVGAAGNNDQDACGLTPGSSIAGMTVGNSNDTDERAYDSNYGPCVDIYAPGSGIASTYPEGRDGVLLWGTSMAAPHVAGAAALYLQRHPMALPAEVTNAILRGATAGVVVNHIAGPNLLLFSRHLGDIEPPTLKLTAPLTASVQGTVTVSAEANDAAELAQVDFYVGPTLLGSDAAAPYSAAWDTQRVANGNYTIRAVAVDLAGNSSTATRTVQVSNAPDTTLPLVTVTFPATGTTVGGTVTLTASASDNLGVNRVEFLLNDALLEADTSAPYSAVWHTAALANGDYTILARAVDTSNNARTSAPVVVRVDNTPAGTLPPGWTASDVGAVGITGAAGYSSGTFNLQAAGADLWSSGDAFHFVHRSWTGDGEVVARVGELSAPSGSEFALAGVMFREALTANARHAALLVSTDGKLKFRRRTAVGGDTLSEGPSAGSVTVPHWLKVTRVGNVFTAWRSLDGRTWSQTGPATTITLPTTVRVGVWALRNGGTALATARFTQVGVDATGTLPAGWANHDIGIVGTPGMARSSGGAFIVEGGGTDLWSTADAFHFVHRTWAGDGDLVVRLATLTAPPGAAWAQAGIMIRESLAPNSRHAAVLVSSDGKLKFRRRLTTAGTTLSNGPSVGTTTVPRWLKLSRRGALVSAYSSSDGVSWTAVYVPQSIELPGAVEVGMWTLRNGGTAIARAELTNVSVTAPAATAAIVSR